MQDLARKRPLGLLLQDSVQDFKIFLHNFHLQEHVQDHARSCKLLLHGWALNNGTLQRMYSTL